LNYLKYVANKYINYLTRLTFKKITNSIIIMNKNRQLDGTPWQQMTQIVEFHETRLNRLDAFAKETLSKTGGDSGEMEERVQTLEEHSVIVMSSIEETSKTLSEMSASIANGITKSNKSLAESKKIITSARILPTKLAVVTEKFRLLSDKVEELMEKITALEERLDEKTMNNITLNIDETTKSDK